MFRPERMSEASIICLKKDFDFALDALNDFGGFHIEEIEENSKPTQHEEHIRQTEEMIRKLDAVIAQLGIKKTRLFDIFRAERIIQVETTAESLQSLAQTVEEEISELKTEVDSLITSLKDLDQKLSALQHLQRVLAILGRFEIDVGILGELHFIYAVVATVSSRNIYELGKTLQNFSGIFYHRFLTKDKEFVFVAAPSKYRAAIEKIVKDHHVEVFRIPRKLPTKTLEALEQVDVHMKKTLQDKERILRSLENLAKTNMHRLLALRETAQNILKMLGARQKALETTNIVTVKGFAPKKGFQKLEEKVSNRLNGRALIIEERLAASQDPPTMMRNPSFIKPFETITKLYGVPHYDELDPTLLIAIMFPLIFGFMFADVGHGLILLIGGMLLGLLIKRKAGLRNFSWVLAACGVGAIFAGLLFGEFFGKHIFAPLWFNPFENVTGFLIFSLSIGVIQIMSGFVLDFINFILKGDIIDAFTTSLPKILFYVGSIYLIVSYQLNFGLWFEGPILLPLSPFVFLIFGKLIIVKTLKIFGRPVENSGVRDSLLERFFEGGDLVTRLLSNTMSYARILALLMAHWALLLVTYVISDMAFQTPVFGAALGVLIVVGGNIFVMAFEGLIVFIHTLRLHFYEWFSKFYQGTGVRFSPFKQSYVYTKIVFKQ